MNKSIFDPYYRVITIKEMLIFTLRLCNMLEKGDIDKNILNQSVTIDNIRISGAWEPKSMSNFAANMRLCMLGTCFIVMDEALDNVFGKKPEDYADNDTDALRAIVYMLRCATAHGPTAPRWQASGIYNRIFRINEIGYKIDATQLDGKIVKHGDYGALKGVITLLDYTLEVLKRHRNEANPD